VEVIGIVGDDLSVVETDYTEMGEEFGKLSITETDYTEEMFSKVSSSGRGRQTCLILSVDAMLYIITGMKVSRDETERREDTSKAIDITYLYVISSKSASYSIYLLIKAFDTSRGLQTSSTI